MMTLNCREVTRRLASDEYLANRWRVRMLIGLHLLLCDKCRRYKLQLRALSNATKQLWPIPENPEEKETLRRLKGEILNNSNE